MDLGLNGQHFLVTGASAGFGHEVAQMLAFEGATVTVTARRKEQLNKLKEQYGNKVDVFPGDLFDPRFIEALSGYISAKTLHGVFVNAGGPPAMGFLESEMKHWDEAYSTVVRWKLQLLKSLLPKFQEQEYGRILFLESASIRQPVNNLVLSNAMRMAVAGAAKTLSLEVARQGITVNILAPGFHNTTAVDRIVDKNAEKEGISKQEARQKITGNIPVGFAGDPKKLASLAAWLLSPLSDSVTGQTYVVDGGNTRFSLG